MKKPLNIVKFRNIRNPDIISISQKFENSDILRISKTFEKSKIWNLHKILKNPRISATFAKFSKTHYIPGDFRNPPRPRFLEKKFW